MQSDIVFALQPDYGLGRRESHRMFWTGCLKKQSQREGKIYQDQICTSFDAGNVLLATVLNAQEDAKNPMNITHVAMLHNDVVPEYGWLDILLDEAERTGADLLSAVIPIKDPNGLSSTAIDSDNPYEVTRRLTMTEVYRLPETFGSEDCGYPPDRLLANIGCFVLRFDKTAPWRNALNDDGTLALSFKCGDRVGRNRGGKWEAQHSPSDWGLSRDLQAMGAKVMATRKVKLLHMGDMPYTSQNAWGEWETDQALKHNFGGVPLGAPAVNGSHRGTDEAALLAAV